MSVVVLPTAVDTRPRAVAPCKSHEGDRHEPEIHPRSSRRITRAAVAAALTVVAAAALAPTAGAAVQWASLTMTSDDGDGVGRGPAAGPTRLSRRRRRSARTNNAGRPSRAASRPPTAPWWHVRAGRSGGRDARRAKHVRRRRRAIAFQEPSAPGLCRRRRDGRGCNTLTGSFTASRRSSFDDAGGTMREPRCRRSSSTARAGEPALRGERAPRRRPAAAAADGLARAGPRRGRQCEPRQRCGDGPRYGDVQLARRRCGVSGTLTQRANALRGGDRARSTGPVAVRRGRRAWEATVAPERQRAVRRRRRAAADRCERLRRGVRARRRRRRRGNDPTRPLRYVPSAASGAASAPDAAGRVELRLGYRCTRRRALSVAARPSFVVTLSTSV